MAVAISVTLPPILDALDPTVVPSDMVEACKQSAAEESTVDVGMGIPNTVPKATGPHLLEWLRHAEWAGFLSLAGAGAAPCRTQSARRSPSSRRREP